MKHFLALSLFFINIRAVFPFNSTFDSIIRECKNSNWYKIHRLTADHSKDYGLWTPYTLKIWYDGMTKEVSVR